MYKVILCKVILFSFIIINTINNIDDNKLREKDYREQLIKKVEQLNYIQKENYNDAYDLIFTSNNNEVFIEHSINTVNKTIFKGVNSTRENINEIKSIFNVIYNDNEIYEWLNTNLNEVFEKIDKYKRKQEKELIEKDKEYILRIYYDYNNQLNIYISITIKHL